jgi:hypothetical protein
MSYTAKYDPKVVAGLESLIEKISFLEEGDSLVATFSSKKELFQTRYRIYNWLYHQDLKPSFRLMVEGNNLRILRRGKLSPKLKNERREVLPDRLDKLFQEIIPLETPLQFLLAKKAEGEITSEELGELMTKYAELMG